jgi:glycosyltransferase involved in cell wall biosynthesis
MATIPWFPGSTFVRSSKAGGLRKVPWRDVIDGVEVSHPRVAYLPGFAGLSGALEVASLLPAFLARRRDIDVVLGSWAYPDGAAAVGLACLIGVPAVIKAHGSDLNIQSSMFGPRASLSFALPRAAGVVAVSKALGEKAISLGVSRDRVHIVQNGTDGSLFRVRDQSAARRGLDELSGGTTSWPRRLVLYCGRIERAKGVMDLIAAFSGIAARAPDLSLTLLGDGGCMAEAKAAAAPLGARIRFLGARPLQEVPQWMAASTLVTLPSHAEGSPNVIREALACGRPVVATSVGGIPELLTTSKVGELGAMVPVRDPTALGEALLEVAGRDFDPSTIAARSGGSWDESAAALLAVLNAAHGSRRLPNEQAR